MSSWTYTQTSENGGYFIVVFTTPGQVPTDVTYFRNTPVVVESYSSGDPFSDSVAVISFPQITGMDNLGTGELGWLHGNANVDIYYIDSNDPGSVVISSLNQKKELDYPTSTVLLPADKAVFQGFVASFETSQTESEASMSVQCQGALLQIDRLTTKPTYPRQPSLYEKQIWDVMSPKKHPSLRIKELGEPIWPDGWNTLFPTGLPNVFTPTGGKPGQKITGYWDRGTGDFTQTSQYILSKLNNMYTQDDSGVKPGDNWTILMGPNRKPRLQVRSSEAEPILELNYGQIGATFSLSSDLTTAVTTVFGHGIGLDGVAWDSRDIAPDGSSTIWTPIAFKNSAYPESVNNPSFYKGAILNETYISYDNLNQQQASQTAQLKLRQFSEPGWTGTVTLSVEPVFLTEEYTSRWQLKAGFSIRIKNFLGTGSHGMIFHVAQVSANPQDGTVELTVDTNYRDLLSLDQVQARQRDPLTPTKLLRLGQTSVIINDQWAPWSKRLGSGCLPTRSKDFFTDNVSGFPWTEQVSKYPPSTHPHFYVRVNANARNSKDRWSFFTFVLSENGTASLTELVAYKADGTRAKVEFHFGIYDYEGLDSITTNNMPHLGSNFDPFTKYFFTTTDDNGVPWTAGTPYLADSKGIPLWGNHDQRAGYWPGQYDKGSPVSGLLKDTGEWTWTFDNDDHKTFTAGRTAGNKPARSTRLDVSSYSRVGAIYCKASYDVFFIGRILYKNQGLPG